LYDADPWTDSPSEACWERYARIERNGAIEYCDYKGTAGLVTLKEDDPKPYRVFLYMQIIGRVWTFLNAVKHVLGSSGYSAGGKYLMNLIDTKDSILADFARTAGKEDKKWAQPFEPGSFGGLDVSKLRCHDANLQFPFRVVLGSLSDSDSQKIISECADQLGLAFNHQSSPRCFAYGTADFPWNQYRATR
jgi:hypothetical protein